MNYKSLITDAWRFLAVIVWLALLFGIAWFHFGVRERVQHKEPLSAVLVP